MTELDPEVARAVDGALRGYRAAVTAGAIFFGVEAAARCAVEASKKALEGSWAVGPFAEAIVRAGALANALIDKAEHERGSSASLIYVTLAGLEAGDLAKLAAMAVDAKAAAGRAADLLDAVEEAICAVGESYGRGVALEAFVVETGGRRRLRKPAAPISAIVMDTTSNGLRGFVYGNAAEKVAERFIRDDVASAGIISAAYDAADSCASAAATLRAAIRTAGRVDAPGVRVAALAAETAGRNACTAGFEAAKILVAIPTAEGNYQMSAVTSDVAQMAASLTVQRGGIASL